MRIISLLYLLFISNFILAQIPTDLDNNQGLSIDSLKWKFYIFNTRC